MKEKVLILLKDERLSQQIDRLLRKFGVDVVDVFNKGTELPFEKLSDWYNIILIDKHFAGNARDTATLVRGMRRKFADPILGMETMRGSGDIFSLTVAGCNMVFSFVDHSPQEICSTICKTIGEVSQELADQSR